MKRRDLLSAILLAACTAATATISSHDQRRTASSSTSAAVSSSCDVYRGSWVVDESYPLYDGARSCPFVRQAFDCRRNGRPDTAYLKYRWQPSPPCTLPRFDGLKLLGLWRGKTVAFVGDSLVVNQYESLLCMLHAAAPGARTNESWASGENPSIAVRFEDYGVTVLYYLSHYLVDLVHDKAGRVVLKLDAMDEGRKQIGAFRWCPSSSDRRLPFSSSFKASRVSTSFPGGGACSSGGASMAAACSNPSFVRKLPWRRQGELLPAVRGPPRTFLAAGRVLPAAMRALPDARLPCSLYPARIDRDGPWAVAAWDYIQDGNTVVQDMDRTQAFTKGMQTWARWIDANPAHTTTKVFFQGYSATHGNGQDWGAPRGKTCFGETLPMSNAAAYHGQPNPQDPIVRRILAGMSKPVHLLDITFMTQLRKDGHTTKYSGDTGNGDCTHWCAPGVPDAWNTVFYWVLSSGNSLRH
nr:unnamed protein product [Digitaria exilis]